jgi:hypothetical protein
MKNSTGFTISPNMVPLNATLLVQSMESKFETDCYCISNQSAQVIRKGKITVAANEFYVSIGGMDSGEYWIEMGNRKEKFTVF